MRKVGWIAGGPQSRLTTNDGLGGKSRRRSSSLLWTPCRTSFRGRTRGAPNFCPFISPRTGPARRALTAIWCHNSMCGLLELWHSLCRNSKCSIIYMHSSLNGPRVLSQWLNVRNLICLGAWGPRLHVRFGSVDASATTPESLFVGLGGVPLSLSLSLSLSLFLKLFLYLWISISNGGGSGSSCPSSRGACGGGGKGGTSTGVLSTPAYQAPITLR